MFITDVFALTASISTVVVTNKVNESRNLSPGLHIRNDIKIPALKNLAKLDSLQKNVNSTFLSTSKGYKGKIVGNFASCVVCSNIL
jgi:hypothetical protein